ncbi:MAG: endonuclease MutS2 [Anaerolineales bacterium]|nr:endonuclease MutS2 [Anaerolineales bacterium]
MEEKSQVTLELPVILEYLAGFAAFSASKDLAVSIEPSSDLETVLKWQSETTEARLLLSLNPGLTIGGAHDVRSSVIAAKRNAVLDPTDLLDIKSTLIAARNIKRLLEANESQTPALSSEAEKIQPVHGIVDSISRTIDERGRVLDNASDKLASIRRDLKVASERLISKLQRLINDPKIIPMLQEPIITQRDGRYVIPLRAEFKGRIKSVIHDRSASGATLFIEPLSVVDLNNQVRELELSERDEIRRILAELSTLVGDQADEISQTVQTLAILDLAFAKGRYAEEMDASEPVLRAWPDRKEDGHPGSTLRLIKARHPLLESTTVVPINLILDETTYALVITGPNTGGKTVALKTTGLLALMAQCGMHIPAESGSELSVFEAIYADIGDEQSIEQSLSTFSSHISNIIRIMGEAGTHSLVLLDELGAGTDPQEGAALARALLAKFLARGVTTLVATHYPELKVYAHAATGVRNASVEFDLESLQPTYHLTIGLPGRSNALAIAERLGLDQSIIDDARSMISPDEIQAEGLLDEIHRQRDAAREASEDVERTRQEAGKLKAELQDRLERIEDERREILEMARHEAEGEIEELKKEMRQLRRRMAAAAQPLDVIVEVEESIDALEDGVLEPVERSITPEGADQRAFRLGDRVHVRTINAEGIVTDLSRDQAEVQIGRLRVRARLEELSFDGDPGTSAESAPDRDRIQGIGRGQIPAAQAPPLELDLRGHNVDEALEILDGRLDAAFLAGMPFIRVIHGKGTGRLREAVRHALKENSYVASFEPGHANEGGDGVTMVKLAVQ